MNHGKDLSLGQTIAQDSAAEPNDSAITTSRVAPHSMAPGQARRFEEQYELAEQLGAGGMGAVYKAKDVALHRTVAVKVMHAEIAERDVMVRRFFKEAQIAAQLEHPGIVPTYTIQSDDQGRPQLAMRLIKGQDLDSLIEEEGKALGGQPPAQDELLDRLELFARACDAVQFAHDKGVVHRDLKPENIMVGPHRDAYVMDWGLATLKGEGTSKKASPQDISDSIGVDDDPKATRFGQLMGTIAYMAPEQAVGDHDEVGPAADQFAMGLTLQELVTLSPARVAPNVTAGLSMAVLGEHQPLPNWVPEGLAAIIQKATGKDPGHRYEDMKSFSEDVRRFLRDEELEAAPDPWQKKAWRILSRHQSLALSALLLLVAAVAALAIVGAFRELSQQKARAAHTAFISKQLATVSARADAINSRATGVESEVARLSGIVSHVLQRESLPSSPMIHPADLLGDNAPTGTVKHERYSGMVNFERPIIFRAKSAENDVSATEHESRLMLIQDDIKEAFERGGLVRGTSKKSRSAPLQWIYVGTNSGVIINYPGSSEFPPDYDPRKRPWFSDVDGKNEAVWGVPYGDAGGPDVLLPCNAGVYDSEKNLLAVIGINFRLSDVEKAIADSDVIGYEASWLLNADGLIIAEPWDPKAKHSPDEDGEVELQAFPNEEVTRAINKQRSSGQIVIGKTRYLYANVTSVDWTYLVATRASAQRAN